MLCRGDVIRLSDGGICHVLHVTDCAAVVLPVTTEQIAILESGERVRYRLPRGEKMRISANSEVEMLSWEQPPEDSAASVAAMRLSDRLKAKEREREELEQGVVNNPTIIKCTHCGKDNTMELVKMTSGIYGVEWQCSHCEMWMQGEEDK